MDKKFARYKNSNNNNLGTIDETNENSFLQLTQPKDATNNFNTQRDITCNFSTQRDIANKEDLQFTKLPKFLLSTIQKPKEQTNMSYNNITPTPNFSLFDPSPIPKNYQRNSNILESEFPSRNKTKINKNIKLFVSNFPYNSIKKIKNELERFGEIKNFDVKENNNVIVVEYKNPLNATEAQQNFNVKLIHTNKPISLDIYSDDENFSNQDGANRSQKKDKLEQLQNIKPNDSPNVSYLNKFIDFFFNW